jgi:RNA polymerase sigma factor (TIGR02999 family)
MGSENPGEVTQWLAAAAEGNRSAIDKVYAILYPELRDLAHQRVRQIDSVAALDTTSLVHESYLRLVKAGRIAVESRRHFLAYAAHVMRSVVVDFVRHARAERRGGKHLHVTLNSNVLDSVESSESEIVLLNELLHELAHVDERLVTVAEMRYFAALDTGQIAESLGVNSRTVLRDLEKIRLLLIDAHS